MVGIEIKGAVDVQKALDELPKTVSTRLAKAALRFGARPLVLAARTNAPKLSGLMARNIRFFIPKQSQKGVIYGVLSIRKRKLSGANHRAGLQAEDPFYGGWVEAGHFMGKRLKGRFKDRSGRWDRAKYHRMSLAAGRQWVEGRHFLERAADTAGGAASTAVAEKLTELVVKEWEKGATP